MKAIEKILVPTDFSRQANDALAAAVDIAKVADAEVVLLHVVEIPTITHYDSIDTYGWSGQTDYDPEIYQHYTKQLKERIEARIHVLRERFKDVQITTHIEFDSLQRSLSEFIVKEQADLIVMGSSGVDGLEEVMVGSNTEKVIRRAKVPVLVIKKHIEGFYPKHIAFASDFQDVTPRVIKTLKIFQELSNATIHFVKIITPNTFEATTYTEQVIREFAQKNEFDNYEVHVFNYFSEEEGIQAFGEYVKADLLAMTTHGRGGLAHVFLGSIAENVANHVGMPLLTFNLKKM